MYGFIYKINDEYALRMGECLYFLFDGISHIKEEVEIGNIDEKNKLEGYCLSINKLHKIWSIKDTGHKNCKDILVQGKYQEGFEESLRSIFKMFNK